MADKIIKCVDCGTEFTFTEAEQAFYAERNLQDPKRCSACRHARKEARKAARAAAKSEEATVTPETK